MVLNDNKVIRLYHGPQQGPQQGTKRGFYVNFSFDNYLIPDVEPSVKSYSISKFYSEWHNNYTSIN